MKTSIVTACAFIVLISVLGPSRAEISASDGGGAALRPSAPGHPGMMHDHHGAAPPTASPASNPLEAGQSAFAAIAEIVEILRRDRQRDWSKVDIEALRRHLIDMNNVTLFASVHTSIVSGGARFAVTSRDTSVASSIRRMVTAHAAEMSGVGGLVMHTVPIVGGTALTVTGPDPSMVRGLGFIGILTIGVHHQNHHLAIAVGGKPHAH